jgi:hypothetical protein
MLCRKCTELEQTYHGYYVAATDLLLETLDRRLQAIQLCTSIIIILSYQDIYVTYVY